MEPKSLRGSIRSRILGEAPNQPNEVKKLLDEDNQEMTGLTIHEKLELMQERLNDSLDTKMKRYTNVDE